MKYTIYVVSTGQITDYGDRPLLGKDLMPYDGETPPSLAEMIGLSLRPGEDCIEGNWSDAVYRVAQGQPVFLGPPPPDAAGVNAERDRRLRLGFDYDFGDARGIHHIGTSDADMKGWSEVTTWATVQALTSNLSAWLEISTDTGRVMITPPEWFTILQAAVSFRDPIWQASFDLAAMAPIPADFAADARWPK